MRSCINGATTMPYSLGDDARSAARAGFAAVEIWHRKLVDYLKEHSVDDVRALLEENGLAVAAICPLFVQFGEKAETARAAISHAADVAARIGCPTLLVCIAAPDPTLSPAEAL